MKINPVATLLIVLIGGYLTFAVCFFYNEHKRSAKDRADNIEMSKRLDEVLAKIANRKGVTPKQVLSEYSPSAAREYCGTEEEK